jgi:uncharacterized membrane protein
MADVGRNMPDPRDIPIGAQKFLRIFVLLSGLFCMTLFVFGWLTSPRPSIGDDIFGTLSVVGVYVLPFVFIASLLLLLFDIGSGIFGLIACVTSVFAFMHTSVFLT